MSLPQNEHQSKSNHEGSLQLDPLSTRCALITGEGRSAIAVIGIVGPAADHIVEQCVRFASDRVPREGQIRFGHWVGPANHGADGESIVLTPMAEQRWEIHCHGGPAAIERILQEMEQSGATQVSELTNDSPLVIAEAESVLRRCLTEKTAAIALSQVRGALRDWAMGLLAVEDPADALQQAREGAQSMLNSARWTTRLTLPWKIVLVGTPNVGKSSLLNALVGFDRSITFDQAGTTRDVLHADTVIAGVPVRLSDTAGIRDSQEPIEAEGMRRTLAAAGSADVVVQVSDATAESVDPPIATKVPLIRVINKIDLNAEPTQSFDVATSAVDKRGIEELLERLAAELTRHQPPNDSPVVLNRRQRDLVEEIAIASGEFPLAAKLRDLIGET